MDLIQYSRLEYSESLIPIYLLMQVSAFYLHLLVCTICHILYIHCCFVKVVDAQIFLLITCRLVSGWTRAGLCLIGMLSSKLYIGLVRPLDGWRCLPPKSLIFWATILTKKVTVDRHNQYHRLELITMNFTITRTYNDDNT